MREEEERRGEDVGEHTLEEDTIWAKSFRLSSRLCYYLVILVTAKKNFKKGDKNQRIRCALPVIKDFA